MAAGSQSPSQNDAPLFSADLDRVRNALALKFDVDAARLDGATPLWWAVRNRRVSIVRALLEAGANVHAPGKTRKGDPSTPLMRAIQGRHPELCQILLDGGATCLGQELIQAVRSGQSVVVLKLLKSGTDPEVTDTAGNTALIKACSTIGGSANALILLGHGASPNVANNEGKTPLMCAAEQGQTDLVKTLILDYKANVGATTKCRETALYFAIKSGSTVVCDFLLKNGGQNGLNLAQGMPDKTLLVYAAGQGLARICSLLLKHGASPDTAEFGRTSALKQAIACGQETVVGILLEGGANANGVQKDRASPLEVAIRKDGQAWRMVELLLEHGADPNAIVLEPPRGVRIRANMCVLSLAVLEGRTEAVTQLLKHGAHPSGRKGKTHGRTALMIASTEDRQEMIRVLLAAGADQKAVERNGNTALHLAASAGCANACQELLHAGSEVDCPNESGQTALHLAATTQIGQPPRTCQTLLEAGATVDAVDVHLQTALMAAATLGHTETCRELLLWGANPMGADLGGESTGQGWASRLQHAETYAIIRAALDRIALSRPGTKDEDTAQEKCPPPKRRRTL